MSRQQRYSLVGSWGLHRSTVCCCCTICTLLKLVQYSVFVCGLRADTSMDQTYLRRSVAEPPLVSIVRLVLGSRVSMVLDTDTTLERKTVVRITQ